MNSETLKQVEPDVLAAVAELNKQVTVDEGVPPGQVEVTMADGSVKLMPRREWQEMIRGQLSAEAEARQHQQEARIIANRKAAHKRERQNRRDGRRQRR